MAEEDVRPTKSESVVSTLVVGKGRDGRRGKKSGGARSQSGLSGNVAVQRSGEGDVPVASTTEPGSEGVDGVH